MMAGERRKITVGLLFGGRSAEHEVSRASAANILSQLGEIVPASKHGFYSYQAKYIDADGAALLVPAELSPQQARRLQELAVEVFRLLGCAGLARVDFFVKDDDMFVNEVNTLDAAR
jgi:D-alanine-D-alanine ligase